MTTIRSHATTPTSTPSWSGEADIHSVAVFSNYGDCYVAEVDGTYYLPSLAEGGRLHDDDYDTIIATCCVWTKLLKMFSPRQYAGYGQVPPETPCPTPSSSVSDVGLEIKIPKHDLSVGEESPTSVLFLAEERPPESDLPASLQQAQMAQRRTGAATKPSRQSYPSPPTCRRPMGLYDASAAYDEPTYQPTYDSHARPPMHFHSMSEGFYMFT